MTIPILTVDTTGGAGIAAGSDTTPIPVRGFLDYVIVTYHQNAPATTTVILKDARGRELLKLSASNTDVEKYPHHPIHSSADGSELANMASMYYVAGPLTLEVTGCDPLEGAVTADVQMLTPHEID